MGAASPSCAETCPDTAIGVTLRRGTLYAAVAAFGLLALWAIGTAWYLVNHDKLAAHLLQKQSEMQYAYERRIGTLRDRLDQVSSHGLVVQESLESRVAELAARNARLETRQAMVSKLYDQAGLTAGPAFPPAPVVTGAGPGAPPLPPKPMPVSDGLDLRLGAASSPDAPQAAQSPDAARHSALPIQDRLGRLQNAITRIETAQLRAVAQLVHRSEQHLSRLRGVLGNTGIDPDRLDPALAKRGVGGPFIPVTTAAGFDAAVEQARQTLALLERFRRASAALPLGRPTAGDTELTSGYGVRVDPFTRGPALHTGVDFRADYGAAVRATGAGQVLSAEPAGGYGNMVEIAHANGITTRYAHLSSLAVVPGQQVAAGTIIGRIGSTGRSTGPHLHYETRIDGQPVDPQRFLNAGARLAEAALR